MAFCKLLEDKVLQMAIYRAGSIETTLGKFLPKARKIKGLRGLLWKE